MAEHEGKRQNTYVVQGQQLGEELNRLIAQDQMTTRGMGGVLPEQDDPERFQRVLDIGCGSGSWLLEVSQIYPHMSLFGIDVNSHFVNYARSQAEAQQVADRVQFHLMDATLMIEFPRHYFDLVNLRFGSSFLRTWDWPKLISEMQRMTRPGGVIRLTDVDLVPQNTSAALTSICMMLVDAFHKAGHLFEPVSSSVNDHLAPLVHQYGGCKDIQTRQAIAEYRAGTPEFTLYHNDIQHLVHTLRPFLQKWGSAPANFDQIAAQAIQDIQQPDFTSHVITQTVWGTRTPQVQKNYYQ